LSDRSPDSSLLRGGSSPTRPGSLHRRAARALALAALFLTAVPTTGRASSRCVPYGLLSDSLGSFHREVVDGCHFGILAVSLERGDTLLALNPDDRFIPASNMKLFVTGAFLRQFGPRAQGVTELGAGGKLTRKHGGREQELKGDLILHASGYPDIVQLLHPGSRGLLDSLAYLLHASGLRKMEGTLWVDGSIFAPEPYGPGWAIDDMPFSYGAPLNAVLANGNAATLLATATPTGVTLSLSPPETPLRIVGRVTLTAPDAMPVLSITRDPGSHVLRVTGRIPRGGTAKRQVSVPDPDSTAGLVLLGAMRRAGIKVRAKVAVVPPGGTPPAQTATLVRLSSPPAAEVVSMVDAYSLNVETEALLRHLDPAPLGKSGAPALRKLTAMLAETGIDTLDLSFVDGSGLSPLNLATPRAFVRWLQFIDKDPTLGAIFRESLASPGAVGTLQKRFPGLDPGVELNAKSGTLTNVSGLSGYVAARGGERVAFSILSNGNRGSVAAAHAAEEAIVGILSRFTRGPDTRKGAPQPDSRMIPR
jgi:D-alanyl-D-alanine carboxypeptidase/D-alanyl-D-alanine-endopeptidase (penicillin-binding protein 4)